MAGKHRSEAQQSAVAARTMGEGEGSKGAGGLKGTLRSRIGQARVVEEKKAASRKHAKVSIKLPNVTNRMESRRRRALQGMHSSRLEDKSVTLSSATSTFERDKLLYFKSVQEVTSAADFPAMLRAPGTMIDDPLSRERRLLKAWQRFEASVQVEESFAKTRKREASVRWSEFVERARLQSRERAIGGDTTCSLDAALMTLKGQSPRTGTSSPCQAVREEPEMLQVPEASCSSLVSTEDSRGQLNVWPLCARVGNIDRVDRAGVHMVDSRAVALAAFVLTNPVLGTITSELPSDVYAWEEFAVELCPDGVEDLYECSLSEVRRQLRALQQATASDSVRALAAQLEQALKDASVARSSPPRLTDRPFRFSEKPVVRSAAPSARTKFRRCRPASQPVCLHSDAAVPASSAAEPASGPAGADAVQDGAADTQRPASAGAQPGAQSAAAPDAGQCRVQGTMQWDVMPGVYHSALQELGLTELQSLAESGQLFSNSQHRQRAKRGSLESRKLKLQEKLTDHVKEKVEMPFWFTDWHSTKGKREEAVTLERKESNRFLEWIMGLQQRRPPSISSQIDKGVCTRTIQRRNKFLHPIIAEGLATADSHAFTKGHVPAGNNACIDPSEAQWELPLPYASRMMQAQVNSSIDMSKLIASADALLHSALASF